MTYTGTDNQNYTSGGNPTIGGYNNDGANGIDTAHGFRGYLSSVRVVNGRSLYTGSSYTVPTAPLTTVANTSILVNFTNASVIDGTAKNDIVTLGTAQISTVQSKYGGASIYCPDQTAVVLTGASFANPSLKNVPLSGDFTVEFWVRVSAPAWKYTYGVFFGIGTYGSGTNLAFAYNGTSIGVMNQVASAFSQSTARGTDGIFHHVVVTRSGTTTKFYYDGIYIGTINLTSGTLPGAVVYINRVSQYGDCGVNNGIYFDDIRITQGVNRYPGYTNSIPVPTTAYLTR